MQFKMTVPIGERSLEITGELEKPSLALLIDSVDQFMDLPQKCGLCESTDLMPQKRTAREYVFYSVVCRSCEGEFKYGQLKDGSGLFAKGWEEKYDSDGGGSQEPTKKGDHTDDDIPF